MLQSTGRLPFRPVWLTDSLAVVGREKQEVEVDSEHAGLDLANNHKNKPPVGSLMTYHSNALGTAR